MSVHLVSKTVIISNGWGACGQPHGVWTMRAPKTIPPMVGAVPAIVWGSRHFGCWRRVRLFSESLQAFFMHKISTSSALPLCRALARYGKAKMHWKSPPDCKRMTFSLWGAQKPTQSSADREGGAGGSVRFMQEKARNCSETDRTPPPRIIKWYLLPQTTAGIAGNRPHRRWRSSFSRPRPVKLSTVVVCETDLRRRSHLLNEGQRAPLGGWQSATAVTSTVSIDLMRYSFLLIYESGFLD